MLYAAPIITPVTTTPPEITGNPLVSIANGVLPIIYFIIGVVAVFYVIYAGYKYVTAGADPKKITDARTTLINAVIGVIIITLAYVIINVSMGIGRYLSNRATNTAPVPSPTTWNNKGTSSQPKTSPKSTNSPSNPTPSNNINEHLSSPYPYYSSPSSNINEHISSPSPY